MGFIIKAKQHTQNMNQSQNYQRSIRGFDILTESGGKKSSEAKQKKKKHIDYKKVLKSKTLTLLHQKLYKTLK